MDFTRVSRFIIACWSFTIVLSRNMLVRRDNLFVVPRKSEGLTPHHGPNHPSRPDGPNYHHSKEKRHSFTSLTTQHAYTNLNRRSAEILAPESGGHLQLNPSSNADRHKRTGNENDVSVEQLPVAYIALYPYKPQKADELELRKGGIYMVTERCQDGWFKGTSNRTQKCGVFPGNYVTPARGTPRSPQACSVRSTDKNGDNRNVVSYTRGGKTSANLHPSNSPPELPPRSASPSHPTNTISSSWHGQQDAASLVLGRSSSAIMSSVTSQSLSLSGVPTARSNDKVRIGRGVVYPCL